MKIKVSVIIPVYNTEDYLKECIESLVNQTLREIEILIVNDGSTDSSLEIMKEFKNKYPNIIKIFDKVNGGQASARNYALPFAQGEYLGFVDSDDWVDSTMYEEMYEKAELHNEDGAWQMIFGVNTIPSHRRHGYAGQLIQRAIEDARVQGRKGLVLTCKDRLVPYYAKFGFKNEGVSDSTHGNVVWYQMRLEF